MSTCDYEYIQKYRVPEISNKKRETPLSFKNTKRKNNYHAGIKKRQTTCKEIKKKVYIITILFNMDLFIPC